MVYDMGGTAWKFMISSLLLDTFDVSYNSISLLQDRQLLVHCWIFDVNYRVSLSV